MTEENDVKYPDLKENGIITNFRYRYLFDGDKKYSTALENEIGGNIVQFEIDKKQSNLMLTESPPEKAIDLWLDNIFNYNIEVFVTLTNEDIDKNEFNSNDLDPAKLEYYRKGQPVNLHHIQNIAQHTNKYLISNQTLIEKNIDYEIWQCNISLNNKTKTLTQIKILNLKDGNGVSSLSKKDLLSTFCGLYKNIIKYSPNLNLAFNCFMGVSRTRFAAFSFLYQLKADNKIINEVMNNTVSYPYDFEEININFIQYLGE